MKQRKRATFNCSPQGGREGCAMRMRMIIMIMVLMIKRIMVVVIMMLTVIISKTGKTEDGESPVFVQENC